jgi:anti-sigma regulatory factor (Ser/Thr protein kinase)
MEWRLDGTDTYGVRLLRDEVLGYLRRHGSPQSDFDGASLILSELFTNVWRHTTGTAWVTVEWGGVRPTLVVRDLGPGFEWNPRAAVLDALGGRGLHLTNHLGDHLTISRRPSGAVVRVMLPVERAPSVSIDPPRRHTNVLPTLEEATPGVGFGRDAFLRALVVQLAASTGDRLGPNALESLVAQVGIDIGGQMEEEFRLSTGTDGPLSTRDLGECFVRLKAAIGGDFRVVEVSDTHVVLQNTACPFGDAVQHAPGLCRMTSSVFGGIAARSTGSDAVVALEQRIAVGDRHCRVVVRVGEGAKTATWGHRYQPPTETEFADCG